MTKRETGDRDRERDGMIDSLRCSRDEPTQYVAPEKGDQMKALYTITLSRLSGRAKRVGAALVWHASAKDGRCDPGCARLAVETELCEKTVQRAIKELAAAKFVTIERRGRGRTNALSIGLACASGSTIGKPPSRRGRATGEKEIRMTGHTLSNQRGLEMM